jgi:hypothetical protein
MIHADRAPSPAELAGSEIAFVFCIEGTAIEPQGLLLAESIRRFAGRYAAAPVVAVNPRPHLPIARGSERRLAELGVRYVREPLNLTLSPYLAINRIVAGRWAERNVAAEYIVLLDTDTLFVRPPSFARADVGVRPVDAKGATSAGPHDPLDAYWSEMCALAGITPAALPYVTATVDGMRVRASYNGGFCIAKRSLGVFQETNRVFEVSRRRDMRPLRGRGASIYASTGYVDAEASEWWGSSQAALSVAIHARTHDVRVYDARYNVPLHLIEPDPGAARWAASDPVLLHYHWLGAPQHRSDLFRRLERFDVGAAFVAWLRDRLEARPQIA